MLMYQQVQLMVQHSSAVYQHFTFKRHPMMPLQHTVDVHPALYVYATVNIANTTITYVLCNIISKVIPSCYPKHTHTHTHTPTHILPTFTSHPQHPEGGQQRGRQSPGETGGSLVF